MASRIKKRPFDELREEERFTVYRKLIEMLIPVKSETNLHITSELIRSIFEIDRMLYFVSPEWWKPKSWAPSQENQLNPRSLSFDAKVGWGGLLADARTNNYYITDESEPAPLCLGWIIQLDGDNRRNTFLNTPWVKAVVPIKPGREQAALKWLQSQAVEGADGTTLDAEYPNIENVPGLGNEGNPKSEPKTIRQVLEILATKVQDAGRQHPLIAEKVFETGYNPLEGGFSAPRETDRVFDEWTEILPTDQIVASEYIVPNI